MSPVAHSAVGLLGWQNFSEKKNLKTLILFILAANLPDIDFAFFLLPGKKAFDLHQFYTHNIFFAGLTVLVFWPWLKSKKERLGFLLVSFSHLLLDFFTIDGAAPMGFKLFYPFSGQLFNLGIFPNLLKGSLSELFSLHNFLVVCLETALFLVPILVVYRKEFNGYLKQKELWKI